MKLIQFSVKHSLFVNFLSVIVVIWGIISLLSLRREAFPNVNFGYVFVNSYYPGASPDEVEKLITIPIEKELRTVDSIDSLTSVSEEDSSWIVLRIDADEKNPYKIVNDIQRAVDRVTDLPSDMQDKPVVRELKTVDHPIIEVSLTGNFSEETLLDHAERLEEILLDIDEVSGVDRRGWRDKQIWVEVNTSKMDDYLISLVQVIRALETHNVTVPGGKIDTGERDYLVRTTGEFENTREVREVIVRSNDLGNPVKIKEIAKVSDRLEEETIINKTDGQKAVNLVVKKKEKADAIDLVGKVKEAVETYKAGVAGLSVKYVNDFSYYVKRRLNILTNNAYVGMFLVALTLFLFLSPAVAVLTALGIPISFLITFIVFREFDVSINLISMFGIIIVLGMLVDDAIIIAENVYRYIEKGMPVREAALKGGSQVVKPVFAAIITTITAFAPLFFVSGITGKFVMNIPLAVTIALAASLFEAFVILPSHISEFVREPKIENGKAKTKKDSWLFKHLLGGYSSVLGWALRHRYLVLVLMFLILAGSTAIGLLTQKVVMFPSKGIEAFFVRGEAPVGTPLSKTAELIKPVEQAILTLPKEELDNIVTTVGQIAQDQNDPGNVQGSHVVQIVAYLTPETERDRDVDGIIEDLKKRVGEVKGFDRFYFEKFKTGPPTGKPVSLSIKGEDFSISRRIAKLLVDRMKQMEGVLDPRDDYIVGKEEVKVVVDEAVAKSAFLTIADIAFTVRYAFEGGVATKIKRAKEEIEVIVKFPESEANNFKAFDKINIPNASGNLIPLKSVAKLERTRGMFAINHVDTKRAVTVSADIDESKTSSSRVNLELQKEFKDIPSKYPGHTVKYGGEFEDTQESIQSIIRAFFISFLLIFLILATTFNSLIQPLIIMASILFGGLGVLAAMLVHGEDISFMVLIGTVGLSGVVINSSIVLVDFINRARTRGVPRKESIIEAGRTRFRPIILTSVTTILGLISVAYGWGGADPFLMPMAKALVWGLAFNTVLTLIVTPCAYAFVDDINSFLWRVFRKRQKYPGNSVKAS